MYIIWLILMALFVGYLAVPAMRELGYSYGRFGRLPDLAIVVIGAVILGFIVVAILSSMEAWSDNVIGAIVLGAIAAFIMVVLLALFSAKAASDEERLPDTDKTPPRS